MVQKTAVFLALFILIGAVAAAASIMPPRFENMLNEFERALETTKLTKNEIRLFSLFMKIIEEKINLERQDIVIPEEKTAICIRFFSSKILIKHKNIFKIFKSP